MASVNIKESYREAVKNIDAIRGSQDINDISKAIMSVLTYDSMGGSRNISICDDLACKCRGAWKIAFDMIQFENAVIREIHDSIEGIACEHSILQMIFKKEAHIAICRYDRRIVIEYCEDRFELNENNIEEEAFNISASIVEHISNEHIDKDSCREFFKEKIKNIKRYK